MSKRIVFLNLADRDPHGLARRSVQSLQRKYPRYSGLYEFFAGANQVTQIDLFTTLDWLRGQRLIGDLQTGLPLPTPPRVFGFLPPLLWDMPLPPMQIAQMRTLIDQANKIMLGAHGHYDNVNTVSAGGGFGQQGGTVATWQDLAQVLNALLGRNRAYRLALIICYGARAASYAKDHDGALLTADIKSSLAYKVFAAICQDRDIVMTARTGAVGFNDQHGHSEVQTEDAITAEVAKVALDAQIGQIRHRLNTLNRTEEESQGDITAFLEGQGRILELTDRASQKRGKYGKFVYTYNRTEQVCRVYRKYGAHPMELLYEGPLA